MKLGIDFTSLDLPFRTALMTSNQFGSRGIQADAMGDLAPDRLTATGRRELRTLLHSFNQTLAAFQVPLRRGIDIPENQQLRIEYLCKVIALACDVGCRLISIPMPKLPNPETEVERSRLLREALDALSRYADRQGGRIALELGLDSVQEVNQYLDSFSSGVLAITFDPANFLVNGFKPNQEIFKVGDRLALVHARDARRNTLSRAGEETAVGNGDIEWMSFIGGLTASNYQGFLIVERQEGKDKAADLQSGVRFLNRFMLPEGPVR